MAKKSPTKKRSASSDNPRIPPSGLSVSNNSDGTFTLSSSKHLVTLGTPGPTTSRSGHRGGIVVAGFVAGAKLPKGTIGVRNVDELEKKLKKQLSSAKSRSKPKELHFRLEGLHTLDLRRLSAITGGRKATVTAHIHLIPDNSKIPTGG